MTYTVIELNPGTGGQRVAVDRDAASPSSGDYQLNKLVFGGEGTYTHVTSSVGYPVNIVQNSLSATSTVADNAAGGYLTGFGYYDTTVSPNVWRRAIGDQTNGLKVNITNASVSVDSELAAAAALSDAFSNPTTAPVGAFGMLWDTSQSPVRWVRHPGDATNGALVNLGANNDVSLNTGSNLVGDFGLSGARTSGGTTLYKNIDVDETEDQVKATAGQIYWIAAFNMTASPLYLQIYNATAASVTVGTTTPDLTFPIPTLATTNGAGFILSVPNGIAFSTAITVACTTDIAATASPTAGPAANGCVIAMGYA